MNCGTYDKAKKQAQANANQTGVSWGYFSDTSGNYRCERWTSCCKVNNVIEVKPEAPNDKNR